MPIIVLLEKDRIDFEDAEKAITEIREKLKTTSVWNNIHLSSIENSTF